MAAFSLAPALQQLDDELAELCAAFHQNSRQTTATAATQVPQELLACDREAYLYFLAEKKQASVTQILAQILEDKKRSLPFLLSQDTDKIECPRGLQVAVLDRSPEGLHMAARLANKPFKQAVRALATELGIPTASQANHAIIFLLFLSFCLLYLPTRVLRSSEEFGGDQTKSTTTNIFDLNRATIAFADEAELKAILEALPRYFDAVLYLDNKFRQQWAKATQPPCLHLNLRLKQETLPAELLAICFPPPHLHQQQQTEEQTEEPRAGSWSCSCLCWISLT